MLAQLDGVDLAKPCCDMHGNPSSVALTNNLLLTSRPDISEMSVAS